VEDRSKWDTGGLIFCVLTLAYGSACGNAVRAGTDTGGQPAIATAAGSAGDAAGPAGDSELSSATPMDVQANIAPFSTDAGVGNGASVAANLSTSNAPDHGLETMRFATQFESPLIDEKNGLLSPAAMSAVVGSYQAGGLVSADSAHIESNLGETDLQDLKSTIVVRTGGVSFNSAPALWRSPSTGYRFHFPLDSASNSAGNGNAITEQGWTQSGGSPVATGEKTSSAQNLGDLPLQGLLTHTPVSQSAPDPVPEPSQFVLMFTVIALAALAAKRSAIAPHHSP
jgi:hypothetical protein